MNVPNRHDLLRSIFRCVTFRYECYECATNDIRNASWLCVNLALALTKTCHVNAANIVNYYPYRAFGCQKNRVFHALCEVGNIKKKNIARTLCDQSFNIDLRLQYVVRIHSSENRAMPRPP